MSVAGITAAPRENDRMQVLMVSDVYSPRVSGVSTLIQTFHATLARIGVHITIVAPDCPGTDSDADFSAGALHA